MKKAHTTVRITASATTLKTVRTATTIKTSCCKAVRYARNGSSGTGSAKGTSKTGVSTAGGVCAGAAIGTVLCMGIGTAICPILGTVAGTVFGTAAGAVIGGLATGFGVSKLLK
ncbi:hypothetical protein [Succinimonas sp.]|uniref:hypothetical protein n=1 Tax=Succinimonas sp. TaxID=1936151 RepID=UPI0038707B6E